MHETSRITQEKKPRKEFIIRVFIYLDMTLEIIRGHCFSDYVIVFVNRAKVDLVKLWIMIMNFEVYDFGNNWRQICQRARVTCHGVQVVTDVVYRIRRKYRTCLFVSDRICLLWSSPDSDHAFQVNMCFLGTQHLLFCSCSSRAFYPSKMIRSITSSCNQYNTWLTFSLQREDGQGMSTFKLQSFMAPFQLSPRYSRIEEKTLDCTRIQY